MEWMRAATMTLPPTALADCRRIRLPRLLVALAVPDRLRALHGVVIEPDPRSSDRQTCIALPDDPSGGRTHVCLPARRQRRRRRVFSRRSSMFPTRCCLLHTSRHLRCRRRAATSRSPTAKMSPCLAARGGGVRDTCLVGQTTSTVLRELRRERWPQPRGPSETLRLPPRSSEAPHVLVLTPMNGALASTALRSGTKAKHHPSRHVEIVRRRPQLPTH